MAAGQRGERVPVGNLDLDPGHPCPPPGVAAGRHPPVGPVLQRTQRQDDSLGNPQLTRPPRRESTDVTTMVVMHIPTRGPRCAGWPTASSRYGPTGESSNRVPLSVNGPGTRPRPSGSSPTPAW